MKNSAHAAVPLKIILIAVITSSLVVTAPRSTLAQAGRALTVSAARVLLLDSSGKTLFEKNSNEAHAPASLVKMMTLYIALEDLESGRAQWDELVTISRRAAATPAYRMGLRAGERVPLSVLLQAIGIVSANDAATAVAEHLASGHESAFVSRMNLKALELGLTHTTFANPHGLPDPSQRSTARDMAELISRLVHDQAAARMILGGQSFRHRGRLYARRVALFDNPGGVAALKTGFTNEAGYNLAVAAWRRGREFLIIVLGAHTRGLSYRDARRVLNHGFVEAGIESAPEKTLKGPGATASRHRIIRPLPR